MKFRVYKTVKFFGYGKAGFGARKGGVAHVWCSDPHDARAFRHPPRDRREIKRDRILGEISTK
ncbi:hypothetical protein B30_07311 [Celeribacter baekdonensis B30]|uniref:Uncharacterized protein n=1 Tax=Celeribacter baekdonensis B30 TaxID=1208323 RepID=K2JDL8_9RHOB|nr:hypothetical protein B30_07311 [Celeribacter baekdonensis B30]